MALCEMRLTAENALGKMTAFTAIVPEEAPGPFPVLYLLGGLSDDHTAWTRRTSLERYAAQTGLLIVMPDGGRGWYTDAADYTRSAYETFLTQDLLGFVDRTFHTVASPEGRAIAGLSMGGYGALKLALKHPDLFGAAISHSGAVEVASHSHDGMTDWEEERRLVFGPNPQGGPNDLLALTAGSDPATRPALRIDCGIDDFLIEHNRRFHAHLNQLGIAHEYEEHPGAHDWVYWNFHILDTLKFCGQHFGFAFRPEDYL